PFHQMTVREGGRGAELVRRIAERLEDEGRVDEERARPADLSAPQLDATLLDVHPGLDPRTRRQLHEVAHFRDAHEGLVPSAEDDRDTHADPFEREPPLEVSLRELRGGPLEHELRFVDPSE